MGLLVVDVDWEVTHVGCGGSYRLCAWVWVFGPLGCVGFWICLKLRWLFGLVGG